MSLFSHDTKAEALGRVPLFSGLARKELTQLAKATEDLEVEAGKVLCREGETAREFFTIVEGEVEVTRGGDVIATLGPGEFFGEIGLFEHIPRTASVTAKSPLRFFVLHSQAFWGLLGHEPEVQASILRALAKRVLADSTI